MDLTRAFIPEYAFPVAVNPAAGRENPEVTRHERRLSMRLFSCAHVPVFNGGPCGATFRGGPVPRAPVSHPRTVRHLTRVRTGGGGCSNRTHEDTTMGTPSKAPWAGYRDSALDLPFVAETGNKKKPISYWSYSPVHQSATSNVRRGRELGRVFVAWSRRRYGNDPTAAAIVLLSILKDIPKDTDNQYAATGFLGEVLESAFGGALGAR